MIAQTLTAVDLTPVCLTEMRVLSDAAFARTMTLIDTELRLWSGPSACPAAPCALEGKTKDGSYWRRAVPVADHANLEADRFPSDPDAQFLWGCVLIYSVRTDTHDVSEAAAVVTRFLTPTTTVARAAALWAQAAVKPPAMQIMGDVIDLRSRGN